jgi:hypothetical protein
MAKARQIYRSVTLLLFCTAYDVLSGQYMVVNVAVADLRDKPVPAAHSLMMDPLENTQLLYNEPVELISTNAFCFFFFSLS